VDQFHCSIRWLCLRQFSFSPAAKTFQLSLGSVGGGAKVTKVCPTQRGTRKLIYINLFPPPARDCPRRLELAACSLARPLEAAPPPTARTIGIKIKRRNTMTPN